MSANTPFTVSDQQVADFERDGFLVVQNFVSKDQVEKLRKRMRELIQEGFDLNKHAACVFSTEKDEVCFTSQIFFLIVSVFYHYSVAPKTSTFLIQQTRFPSSWKI